MTPLWLIALSCLLMVTVYADKIYPLKKVNPGDDITLWPDMDSKRAVTKWSFETCEGCRIILSCVILLSSCLDHILTINDGKKVKTFCGEGVNYGLGKSYKNWISFSMDNEGGKAGSFCRVLVTEPYTNTKFEVPDSSEHGLGRGATRQPSCKCGWRNKSPGRIVGGSETGPNEYPFAVLIMLKRRQFPFCGGSIITPNHVLTAAHCTKPVRGIRLSVILGAHDITPGKESPHTKSIDVAKTTEHPLYKERQNHYDISIMKLKESIVFNDVIGPVCLPNALNKNYLDEYVKVVGWGLIENNGTASPVLKQADLKVINLDICKVMFASVQKNSSYQLCTWAPNADSCQGDSGGPLFWNDPETNALTQVGVVSFGHDCASLDPAVNTNVDSLMQWVKNNTDSEAVCS
uniref:Venom S1 protease 16 n=1 Tax=Oncocephalus sp. TaxID=2944721 RepID=A0AB38ZEJ0_9HEMI